LIEGADEAWPYRPGAGGAGSGREAEHGSYNWLRAVGVGGRLNFWNGTSLRLEAEDLADARAPGLAWPIGYDELEPYYTEIEDDLGCCHAAGDGRPPDLASEWVAAAARSRGVTMEPPRASVRPGEDMPGARFRSFSPLERWVPDAVATGRCTVLPFTVVRRVLVSAGRVRGVEAVAGGSSSPFTIEAPRVVAATSTIETARLLLESAGPEHPAGLGNHGGRVGSHLMDHVVVWARAFVAVPADQWDPDRPVPAGHIAGWPPTHDLPPPSRFHVQVGIRDVTDKVPLSAGPGRRVVAIVLGAVGEGLAIAGNEVVLDPAECAGRDSYGNLVPRVRFGWDAAHLKSGRFMHAALLDLLSALPCDVLAVSSGGDGPDSRPLVGGYGHEVGTARMGIDPATSVVSPRGEVHGVDNLFVVDGSVFVSYPHKNPTLPILANCARTCDALAAGAGP